MSLRVSEICGAQTARTFPLLAVMAVGSIAAAAGGLAASKRRSGDAAALLLWQCTRTNSDSRSLVAWDCATAPRTLLLELPEGLFGVVNCVSEGWPRAARLKDAAQAGEERGCLELRRRHQAHPLFAHSLRSRGF